jgi:hypothetical protein
MRRMPGVLASLEMGVECAASWVLVQPDALVAAWRELAG